MDWSTLIAENFDKLLVIISTLLGGVLGGGITFFVQSRLQERQRWSALYDHLKDLLILDHDQMSSGKIPSDNDIRTELTLLPEIYGLDYELGKLRFNWINLWRKYRNNPKSMSLELVKMHANILRRINQLIEETYDPAPPRSSASSSAWQQGSTRKRQIPKNRKTPT